MAQQVKNPPAVQETQEMRIRSLGIPGRILDPPVSPGGGNGNHASILA